ncbi:MAG TPA: hypothetical protein VH254_04360 [Candidatus Udaeobacter sp.]|jgi:hypothetical protein|nr:hypothetical protein [Candidatus Udaeobacter sp.]
MLTARVKICAIAKAAKVAAESGEYYVANPLIYFPEVDGYANFV